MVFKIKQSPIVLSIVITLCALQSTPSTYAKKTPLNYTVKKSSISQACFCDFCSEIRRDSNVKTYKLFPENECKNKKIKLNDSKRTIMIYMAADNNLRPFAARNIQQMAHVGSNEYITILVHLDIRLAGNKKVTRRYLVEKEEVFHIDPLNLLTQHMDSGNPATLISFCEWAIKQYNAQTYDLILWNHGTGILEPAHYKIINPMDLFVFNAVTNRFELDRSIGFMEAIEYMNTLRGVCWDDTTGNYLSNRKLETALKTICQKCLHGNKFGIIGFDACLMSMTEIASFVKEYAHAMVASEEVELGMGWKYDEVLLPFTHQALATVPFACHIVSAYNKTYQAITNDYTLSAINLDRFGLLEKNIDHVAQLLIQGLTQQKNIFYALIKDSRSKLSCTHFDEPTYIDLYHFYKNIGDKLTDTSYIAPSIKKQLIIALNEGMNLIKEFVVANTCGKNLKNAHGISIYFPERSIHSSYQEALFLHSNAWSSLLNLYIFG